jgi:hypothetical protein
MTPPPQTLDDLQKFLVLQAEIAVKAKSLSDLDPVRAREFLVRLAALLAADRSRTSGLRNEEVASGLALSIPDRLARVFVQNGNRPLLKRELASSAGLTNGSVHTALYATAPNAFLRTPNPAGGKGLVICLTNAAYEKAMAGNSILN